MKLSGIFPLPLPFVLVGLPTLFDFADEFVFEGEFTGHARVLF